MKSKILFLFFIIANIINAQNSKNLLDEINYGINGGISYSNYIIRLSPHKVNPRIMPFFGIYGTYQLKNKIFFQPAIILSFIGGKQHTFIENTTNPEYISDEKLTYLTVPLNLKYYINKISFLGGLQAGFRLSAKYKNIIIDEGTEVYSAEEDISKYRKFFDLGMDIGLEYKFSDQINFELRYYLGITPINHNTNRVKLYNSIVQTGILYKLK